MARSCLRCGEPVLRARQARYCSRTCYRRACGERHRARHRDDRRAANKRYYKQHWEERAAYRAAHREKTRTYVQVRRHLLTYGHLGFLENPLTNTNDRFRNARAVGYRSGLEVQVARQLDDSHVAFKYEPFKIPFVQPAKERLYQPDFLLPNGIVVETKGQFLTADRQKHAMLKGQYPDLDLRFVFSDPSKRISKISKTTYAAWCETHGFPYAKGRIPEAWLREPPNKKSLEAIKRLTK